MGTSWWSRGWEFTCQPRDAGSIPGPQTRIPHAASVPHTEPVGPRAQVPKEATEMSIPCSTQLETARAQQWRACVLQRPSAP